MSGTAHSHWGHHNASQGRQWTSKLARIVNCPDHNNTQLVECLRRMDGNWLVAAQMNLFVSVNVSLLTIGLNVCFVPNH
jgi:hypothetical protein